MQERFWNTGCKDVRFSEYGTAVNLPRASHPQKLCVRVRWALMRERSLEGAACCHGWACILNQRPHINFPYNVDVAASCYGGASLQQALECFRTTFMFESEEVWSWMCSRTTVTWAVSHLWVGKNRSVQTHKADSPESSPHRLQTAIHKLWHERGEFKNHSFILFRDSFLLWNLRAF